MIYKHSFKNDADRDRILNENPTLTLVEEQITFEGNFILLSDDPKNDVTRNIVIPISEEEFSSIKQRQDATDAAILQLMMEGMV